MRYYAIYYTFTRRSDDSFHWVECLGSDGVGYLDGRLTLEHQKEQAKALAKTRIGCQGFRIARGHSLGNLFYLTANVEPTGV